MILLLAASSFAADKPDLLTWETTRTTAPDSVDELKALQAKVKQVQKKANPCTVGLLLAGSGSPFSEPGMSCGSGVIVSEDGLVLTAAHVISKPRERVLFVLSDGRRVSGITLGLNSSNDSGMARITDKPPKGYPDSKDGKWPFMPIGSASDLKQGQWVVSMGHPGGPKADRPPPVRIGQFLEREKPNFSHRNVMLKTDAALVGGDSGGPLYDLDGKVIGIHSQIEETLEGNLHVPLEDFRANWDRMVRGDIIFRFPRERDRSIKVSLDVDFDKSATDARIEMVKENGVAEKAGIEAGDVLAKFNGHPVKSEEDLKSMLPSYKVGEKVKVEVVRGGHPITLELKLSDKASR
jgi:serine protease Do